MIVPLGSCTPLAKLPASEGETVHTEGKGIPPRIPCPVRKKRFPCRVRTTFIGKNEPPRAATPGFVTSESQWVPLVSSAAADETWA